MFIFPCHILVYHQTYRLIHMFAVLDLSRAEMNQTRHSFTYFINCFGTTHRVPIHGIYLNQLYAHFAFCLVLFSPSFFFNMLLIIAILRQSYLKNLPNILIMNILFENMVNSSMICVWTINFILATQRHQVCCLYLLTVSVGYSCSLVALFEIWLLSVERYIAVFKPCFYEERKNTIKKVFILLILLSWVVSAILGGTSFLIPQFKFVKFTIAAIIPCSIVYSIVIHLMVYSTTQNLIKSVNSVSPHDNTEENQNHAKISTSKAQDRKLTIITASLVIQLIICYIPFCIVMLYKAVIKQSDADISVIFTWSVTAAAIKSITNPITFLYQLKTVRKSFFELLCRAKDKAC